MVSLVTLSRRKKTRARPNSEAPSAEATKPTAAEPVAVPTPLSDIPLPIRWGLLAAAALLLLGIFSTEVADTDSWWHLAAGRYIVEQGRLPVPDPFSYTSELGDPSYPGEEKVRRFNLTHEWLAQVVWYLIYLAGGFPALVLWKACLLGLVCAAAGYLAARRSGSFLAGIAAALAAVPVLTLFSAGRPALLSFLFVALFVVILERHRDGRADRLVWLLVPLEILWANSHGGFFLGWVTVGAYVAGCRGLSNERRKTLLSVAFAVFLVAGLNPNGFRILEVLPAYRTSFLTSTLIEWKPPFLWGPPYTYNVLLYGAAAMLLLSWRGVRLTDALLFAAFAAASLTAFRNTPLIAFLAPVLMAAYGGPLVTATLARIGRPRWPARTLLCVAAAGMVAVVAVFVQQSTAGRVFQLRAAEWKFPVTAGRFLQENKVEQRMFNSYEFGGYLLWSLWPSQRTFIDGRALNESVYRDYRKILYNRGRNPEELAELDRLLAAYGAEIVVTNAFEYVRGVIYPLVLTLGSDSNASWRLVFEDGQALVFAHDIPANEELISRYQIPKSRLGDHLEKACGTYIKHYPRLPNCGRTLGLLFAKMGLRQRAERTLDLYLSRINYPDLEARQAYQRLRNGGGR